MGWLKRTGVVVLWLAASVGCDQATKAIATEHLKGGPVHSYLGDTFRLLWATNDGAFLSLGSNLPDGARFGVLTVAVGLLLLGIVGYALASPKLTMLQVVGYAVIAGGGLSNWVDRARFGGVVVDFMNLGVGSLRTGIFNVADLAIIAGIVVLFVDGWRKDRERAVTPPAPG